MSEDQIIRSIIEYFKTYIFENHIAAASNKHSKLSSYNINPVIVQYLSKILDDGYTPLGVAKALFYPRVLGTSINTSFGTKVQNMFVELELADGSMIKGMDIEFYDRIDDRKKWCQLKSGPNTINSEDVNPLINKFQNTINLARTNNAFKGIVNNDFIVGVIYGERNDLSSHYLKIDRTYPVYTGEEFWVRLTGYPKLYEKLVQSINVTISNLDTKDLIKDGCQKLAHEIESSSLFDFK